MLTSRIFFFDFQQKISGVRVLNYNVKQKGYEERETNPHDYGIAEQQLNLLKGL